MTEARLRAGLSQIELAKLMRTAQGNITRWETGGKTPNLTTLLKLAEVTGHQLEIRLIATMPENPAPLRTGRKRRLTRPS
jgi:uncharacterized protein